MTLRPRSALAAMLAALPGLALAQYATPMRDVDNPDRSPYMASGSATINSGVVNSFLYFATPVGKRYFPDLVTVQCSTPSASDTFPLVQLVTLMRTGGGGSFISVASVQLTFRGREAFSNRYLWAGQIALSGVYADPNPFDASGGNGLYLNLYHSDVTVQASCTGFLGAHTLPAP